MAFYTKSNAESTTYLVKCLSPGGGFTQIYVLVRWRQTWNLLLIPFITRSSPGLAKLLNQLGYLTLESAKPEIETSALSKERKHHCCLQIQPHLTCSGDYEHPVEELVWHSSLKRKEGKAGRHFLTWNMSINIAMNVWVWKHQGMNSRSTVQVAVVYIIQLSTSSQCTYLQLLRTLKIGRWVTDYTQAKVKS